MDTLINEVITAEQGSSRAWAWYLVREAPRLLEVARLAVVPAIVFALVTKDWGTLLILLGSILVIQIGDVGLRGYLLTRIPRDDVQVQYAAHSGQLLDAFVAQAEKGESDARLVQIRDSLKQPGQNWGEPIGLRLQVESLLWAIGRNEVPDDELSEFSRIVKRIPEESPQRRLWRAGDRLKAGSQPLFGRPREAKS